MWVFDTGTQNDFQPFKNEPCQNQKRNKNRVLYIYVVGGLIGSWRVGGDGAVRARPCPDERGAEEQIIFFRMIPRNLYNHKRARPGNGQRTTRRTFWPAQGLLGSRPLPPAAVHPSNLWTSTRQSSSAKWPRNWRKYSLLFLRSCSTNALFFHPADLAKEIPHSILKVQFNDTLIHVIFTAKSTL